MKKWVPEFLRLAGDFNVSREQLDRELLIPEFCRRRLLNCFLHNLYGNRKLEQVVGSVLADITAGTFFDLLTRQRLMFVTFHDYGAALNVPASGKDTAVILLDPMDDLPFSAARGVVSHELLGHVKLGHHREKVALRSFEEEADACATAEGFKEDISALRKFKKEV